METIKFKPIETTEALAFENLKGNSFVVTYHDNSGVRFSPIKLIPNTDVWVEGDVEFGWPIDFFQQQCVKQFTIKLKTQ